MASIGELEPWTDEEATDLNNRLERFRAAWKADGSTDLEWYLPPPGMRHRFAVLLLIIREDMERRARAKLPIRAETYLGKFPEDLTASRVPIDLLAHEYQLRHRFADQPTIEEYNGRFPGLYEAFARFVAQLPPQATAGPGGHTPVTVAELVQPITAPPAASPRAAAAPVARPVLNPPAIGVTRRSTIADARRPVAGGSAPASGRVGELIVTDSVDLPGETVNRVADSTILPADTPYQLVAKLGSGAFGEVYEALAPGGIRVAVKRILRTVDHPASKSEREALDAIKGLSHPFLLKTNAYWVFADRLVIVMELADYSLGDRLEHFQKLGHTGIPPEELIPIFEQAGEALDYLHSQNVSHRDIKPENILMLQGYAKVGDFGLAHLHQHTMTMVPNTVGTPAYMPPEMWKQKVSLQSDQYSLAATYVRVRLGRHLFANPVLVDQANCHINETPNLDPLPVAEQKVILKALAKDPNDRFPSCSAFAKALREAVFPPPEPPEPTPPREGRRGALLGSLIAAAACALVVGGVNWFTQKHAERNNDKEKAVVLIPREKKFAPYAGGWQPVEDPNPKQIDDRFYHHKLTRQIGDRQLTAHLLPPTLASHPAPFYMLEYKVTNKVFLFAWERVLREQRVKVVRDKRPELVPEKWRNDENGKPLDLDGADADLPVLGVTVPEAMLVAEWLGGSLPTYEQWQKATGLLESNVTSGPAGPPLRLPEQVKKDALRQWKRDEFRLRGLALGRPRALPVTDPSAAGDMSVWDIRQLVSNGPEWLGQVEIDPKSRLALFPLPTGPQEAFSVGHSPFEEVIDAPSTLLETPARWPWDKVEGHYAGFRIVLEFR